MPTYRFLAETDLPTGDIAANLAALKHVGVPYSGKDIEQAESDLKAQADPDADAGDLAKRYPQDTDPRFRW